VKAAGRKPPTKAVAPRRRRGYKDGAMSQDESPAVVIRPAEPADGAALIGAIEQIDRETEYLGAPGERPAWADQPAATLARLQASGDGVYMIAVRDGAIVGYVGAFAGYYRSTRGVLSIHHIGVRRALRGQAVATRLLDGLEDWARPRGAHRLDLTVDEDNAPARALYRKHGYVEEGRIREAARDPAGWRSYIALAKSLDAGSRDTDGTEAMAVTPVTRRLRTDSLAVRFRPAAAADAAALHAWELALLASPPAQLKQADEVGALDGFAAALAGMLANSLHFLVTATLAEGATERIVGLLVVSAKPQPRLLQDLGITVNVLADYRGLGIGRRLYEIGEDWARARGAHRLATTVHAANAFGLRFAAALGFEREVVMPRYARFGAVHVDLLSFAKLLPG
jgi:RimJ/RimL family protein N-acetyltransferase